MDRISAEVEQDPYHRQATDAALPGPEPTVADLICHALRRAAAVLPVKAIVTYTTSGSTALRAARARPPAPILGLM
jgi:pyruvate kinase